MKAKRTSKKHWRIKLNNTEAELKNMEREPDGNKKAMNDAANAIDNTGDNADKLADDMEDVCEEMENSSGNFEKEGIYNFHGKGELLITIMFSLAPKESRSISENITWGQRKSFSDDKVHLPYKRFLKYEKSEYSRPAIVEKEAATVDFLEKKLKINESEVSQFYVTSSHPSISETDEWDLVQTEIARRKSLGKAYSGESVLSAKLVCEDCELMRKTLTDFKSLDVEIEQQSAEVQVVAKLVKALVKENVSTVQSQETYLKRYESWSYDLLTFDKMHALKRPFVKKYIAKMQKALIRPILGHLRAFNR